ncbi:MAG: NDP-hexose 4-ketoreductase, partial [Brachybacterium sp.]
SKVHEELKQHFKPEFLNRVDDVVVFPQLSQSEIVQIVDLEVGKLDARLRDKDMAIELTPVAKDLLAEKGYDPVLGARPLRRTIQRDIEDTLSERILFGQIQVGDQIVVDAEGEGLLGELTFSRRAGEGGTLEPIPEVIDIESMTQARAEEVTRTDGSGAPDTDSAEASAN